jgi:hypothetical protein
MTIAGIPGENRLEVMVSTLKEMETLAHSMRELTITQPPTLKCNDLSDWPNLEGRRGTLGHRLINRIQMRAAASLTRAR